MKNQLSRLRAVVCVLVVAVSAIQARQEPSYRELPNFHKLNDQFYRGAQPANEGIRKLSELGIKAIVNLRGDQLSWEQKEAESSGLRYFNIPMPGLSAPTDEQVAQVMAVINDPANQPVFIHCKRGADRTGTVAAIYRISRDGWTADRAITEAGRNGMSWAEFGMRRYIANYYKQQVRTRNQPATVTSN